MTDKEKKDKLEGFGKELGSLVTKWGIELYAVNAVIGRNIDDQEVHPVIKVRISPAKEEVLEAEVVKV